MAERIRFHLDEQVNPDVAQALRAYGIDVTTTVEAGLRAVTDIVQLEYARDTGRVLVTHDADFLRLAATSVDHAGIAYCHQNRRTVGEIVRILILIHELLSQDEMAGRLEYL